MNNNSSSCDDKPDCSAGACYGQDCNPQGECEKQINQIKPDLNHINKMRPRPSRNETILIH